MNKDPRVYLAQILERIDRIKDFTSNGKDAFFSDIKTQVLPSLEDLEKEIAGD